jgi:thiol-disulfide isomerase/thioredoxin
MKAAVLMMAAVMLNAAPQWKQDNSITPGSVESLSWQARQDLALGNVARASAEAESVLSEAAKLLQGRALDSEPSLANAVGAAYEVQAQALAEQHRSAEAIQLLRNAMHRWSGTSIVTRLQKNVNLLTLVGKPMPALRVPEWIGGTRPATAGALRGKVVMLFFWAHWCPDCKAEAPVLAKVAAEFEPKGLVVIAPTERYGYTPSDEHALPAEEKAFIEKVFDRFYAEIPKVQVPLDSGNFQRFGASTTPTLVLVDRKGVVRLYHPGVMDEASLRSAVQSLINS